jgi:hypothetical protein
MQGFKNLSTKYVINKTSTAAAEKLLAMRCNLVEMVRLINYFSKSDGADISVHWGGPHNGKRMHATGIYDAMMDI